jgi:hypothetical protein
MRSGVSFGGTNISKAHSPSADADAETTRISPFFTNRQVAPPLCLSSRLLNPYPFFAAVDTAAAPSMAQLNGCEAA